MVDNPFSPPAEAQQTAAQSLISVEQQRAVAEVQAQLIIARANPRDPRHAMDLILQDCTRLSLAESALYEYARGGTEISGPSIRLMETVARRWGNIASAVKEISRRDGYSECVAYCWDLESNYRDEKQFQVRHWRDRKGGGGYRVTDERDIYEMVANQGARRKRAAIQAVIPGDVIEAAVQQCEETLKIEADTSPEALKKLVEAFAQFGVSREQIEVRCQRRLDAIRPAQVVQLRKIWASLRDEMSQPGDWFEAPQQQMAAPATGNEALRAKMAQTAADPATSATVRAEAPAEPAERAPVPDVAEHAAGEDGPSAAPGAAGTSDFDTSNEDAKSDTAPDPASTPDRPREDATGASHAALPEGDAPMVIEAINPVRLRRGGWDWPRYTDEYIALGRSLPRDRLGEFRAKQAAMFDALRNSNKELWAEANQALAEYEREGA
jgi:hypothetical protein